jgi:urease accessory protein UreF
MAKDNIIKRTWRPLESRKVRVALATVIAAFAAHWGFNVEEELVFTILGVGASLILGIAHEDAGKQKQSATYP